MEMYNWNLYNPFNQCHPSELSNIVLKIFSYDL